VPSRELKLAAEFNIGDMLELSGWLGTVMHFKERLVIRLSNNSFIEPEVSHRVFHLESSHDNIEIGDLVKTHKANLERGTFSPFNCFFLCMNLCIAYSRLLVCRVQWLEGFILSPMAHDKHTAKRKPMLLFLWRAMERIESTSLHCF
jgi:hypothetical protein